MIYFKSEPIVIKVTRTRHERIRLVLCNDRFLNFFYKNAFHPVSAWWLNENYHTWRLISWYNAIFRREMYQLFVICYAIMRRGSMDTSGICSSISRTVKTHYRIRLKRRSKGYILTEKKVTLKVGCFGLGTTMESKSSDEEKESQKCLKRWKITRLPHLQDRGNL